MDEPLKKDNIRYIDQMPQLQDLSPDDLIIVQDVSETGNPYRKESLQAVVDRMNPLQSVNLTQAEYDALPEAEKLNGTYYNVTDDSPPPLQIYFDIEKPIGYVYEQLPPTLDEYGTERVPASPNDMFNNDYIHSTWVRLDFGGAFFRSEGGKASVFGTGIQSAQLPNITGETGADNNSNTTDFFTDAVSSRFESGALKMRASGRKAYPMANTTSGTSEARLDRITFDAHLSNPIYTDGGEVRPETLTTIKWIRVA